MRSGSYKRRVQIRPLAEGEFDVDIAALTPLKTFHTEDFDPLDNSDVRRPPLEWGELKDSKPEPRIHRPIGFMLRYIAEFFFSQKAFQTVLEPAIRDLQSEYFEALAAGRLWKSRWVALRGRLSFWVAFIQYVNGSLVQWIIKLSRPL